MSNLYRKKPVVVRAIQWNGKEDNKKCEPAQITRSGTPGWSGFEIETLEGWLKLVPGSYVVGPGAKGEFWPVDKEVFEATYERVKTFEERHNEIDDNDPARREIAMKWIDSLKEPRE